MQKLNLKKLNIDKNTIRNILNFTNEMRIKYNKDNAVAHKEKPDFNKYNFSNLSSASDYTSSSSSGINLY